MTKYLVTLVRTGCVFVKAESEAEALDIVNHQFTDDIIWSDDFEATDIEEDDSAEPEEYITDKAFG